MLVQILCDNINSWIIPYIKEFVSTYEQTNCVINFTTNANEIKKGDVLVLLSCEKLFSNLKLNKHNLVVHESDLPKGKGWSPLTWQIVEGKKEITVTLFEATEKVDSGMIYDKEIISFNGLELVDELRAKQAKATFILLKRFLQNYPNINGYQQVGEVTYYKKRIAKDSELNIHSSLNEQFNLLRVCDNERYPAHFYIEGQKYILKIEKEKN